MRLSTMKAAGYSDVLANVYQTTQHNNPEDGQLSSDSPP
jgi:hypothetical protein